MPQAYAKPLALLARVFKMQILLKSRHATCRRVRRRFVVPIPDAADRPFGIESFA